MFKSIMHVSFFTEDMERTRDFYENKLGLKPKMIVRYGAYKDNKASSFYAMAEKYPDEICIIYFEIAPGQFVEFFPANPLLKQRMGFNESFGYSHFALLVDDIHATREQLVAAGIDIDVEPKIGNSHTWQMWIHDPDGNRFEIMQYTDQSFQVVGHL